MDKQLINKIESYVLGGIVFLLPLIVLPIFPNPYNTAKLLLLSLGISLILILKLIKPKKGLSFSVGKFDIPVLLLSLVYILTSLIQTPSKFEAFFLPGISSFIILGGLIYFIVNQANKEDKEVVKISLIASLIVYSILLLIAKVGIFKNIASLSPVLKAETFNTIGGVASTFLFVVPLSVLAIEMIIKAKSQVVKVFAGTGLTFSAIAIVIGMVLFFGKDTSPRMPSLSTSWVITAETLKVSPFFGVGPGNYLTAFNLFRPVAYNQTDLWQIRFNSASNFYLYLITETGLLGLGVLILFAIIIIRESKTKDKAEVFEKIALLIFLAMLFIVPSPETLIVLLFVLLALSTQTKNVNLLSVNSSTEVNPKLPYILIAIPVVLGVLLGNFVLLKNAYAETVFNKATQNISKNEGKAAYDTLQKAINTNPYSDRYHSTYAQINMALANAISAKDKSSITEADKKTIASLIQQAVREAKIAVALNPRRAANWELLASTYRAIIGVAKDADKFSVQSYAQAIALDPLNPNIRIALGGIFYGAKNYDASIDTYKLAVLAKNDYANARYNLALAYQGKGDIERAIAETNAVLSLVKKDSKDYEVASKLLESLQKNKKPTDKPEGSDNLTPPDAGGQIQSGEISLPVDATPPAAVARPSASPTPIPAP